MFLPNGGLLIEQELYVALMKEVDELMKSFFIMENWMVFR